MMTSSGGKTLCLSNHWSAAGDNFFLALSRHKDKKESRIEVVLKSTLISPLWQLNWSQLSMRGLRKAMSKQEEALNISIYISFVAYFYSTIINPTTISSSFPLAAAAAFVAAFVAVVAPPEAAAGGGLGQGWSVCMYVHMCVYISKCQHN